MIFSVWDPTKGDAANAVPVEQRVEVLHQGDDVEVKRFGGEGTGGQSFFAYDWKLGQTYRFLVKATVTEGKSEYAGYFYLPESSAWKHLVTFRTRTGGEKLKGLSRLSRTSAATGRAPQEIRRESAMVGCRIQQVAGARYCVPALPRPEPLGKPKIRSTPALWAIAFFLQTGGVTATSTPLNSFLVRRTGKAGPPQVP